jgi:hypothetical protein
MAFGAKKPAQRRVSPERPPNASVDSFGSGLGRLLNSRVEAKPRASTASPPPKTVFDGSSSTAKPNPPPPPSTQSTFISPSRIRSVTSDNRIPSTPQMLLSSAPSKPFSLPTFTSYAVCNPFFVFRVPLFIRWLLFLSSKYNEEIVELKSELNASDKRYDALLVSVESGATIVLHLCA